MIKYFFSIQNPDKPKEIKEDQEPTAKAGSSYKDEH